jgi:hypothetical protein
MLTSDSQQYYAALIKLHQIFAWNQAESNLSRIESRIEHKHLQHLAEASQSVCSNHAVQIARIFEIQQSRFDVFFITLPSLQAALTAAGALMDAICQANDAVQRDLSVGHLKGLFHTFTAMTTAYQPAETMIKAIQSFLEGSAS